jgi:hypothetical protein
MSMPVKPDARDFFFHLFTAPEGKCETCGRERVISQWRGRHVERLDGYHILAMRDRRCPDLAFEGRGVILRAADEHRFALKHDVYGLDVMLETAERRLQDDLSFEEIQRRLNARGVPISLTSVCEAFKRFVALTSCRAAESEETREKLRKQVGMVVLIDGVQFDDRSPVFYLVIDAISRTPLFAERHAVRSKAGLVPLLRRLEAMNVPIKAFVTDMEKGLVPAIRPLREERLVRELEPVVAEDDAGDRDEAARLLHDDLLDARGDRDVAEVRPLDLDDEDRRPAIDGDHLVVRSHGASWRRRKLDGGHYRPARSDSSVYRARVHRTGEPVP